MNSLNIFLCVLQATSVIGDLIGWNRLQGAVIRSTTQQPMCNRLFDRYLVHLGSKSRKTMNKMVKLQKNQFRKYLQAFTWKQFIFVYFSNRAFHCFILLRHACKVMLWIRPSWLASLLIGWPMTSWKKRIKIKGPQNTPNLWIIFKSELIFGC